MYLLRYAKIRTVKRMKNETVKIASYLQKGGDYMV